MAMWLCGYVDQFQNFKCLSFKNPKSWVHTWSRIFDFFGSHICKDHICPGCSQNFSWFFLGVLASPKINKVGFGSRWHVKSLRNHEMLSFGPIKILKILFKYNFTIKLPKNAIIIMTMIYQKNTMIYQTKLNYVWPDKQNPQNQPTERTSNKM